MTRGLRRRTSSKPSPSRAAVPGRQFSSTTSARAARRRTIARPSGALRSTVIERLLRFTVMNAADGVLHLDHVGAQIAEQHRAVRARELVREVEDAEAVERAGRHHGSVY